MAKRFLFLLGLCLLLTIFLPGLHVDNWRIVTVRGTVVDGVTREALDEVGVTNVWWFDKVPPEVEPKVRTASDGEFSLRLKLHWAFHPYNLVVPSKYQPFELFFMKDGHASRWIDCGEFRVNYFAGPDQEINVGEVALKQSGKNEKPLSMTLMETLKL